MTKAVAFAGKAVDACEEYVFLDKLQYLAEGGRLSKTGAFFGDMLNVKPIISPLPEGAKKVGTAKNQENQMKFALAKLDVSVKDDSKALMMLEYLDSKKLGGKLRLRKDRGALSESGNYSAAAVADVRRAYGPGDVGGSFPPGNDFVRSICCVALHPRSLRRMSKIRLIPRGSRALHLELFTKPLVSCHYPACRPAHAG